MKTIIRLAFVSVIALANVYGATAAEFTKCTVKKIDAKAKKVTLIHEELKALDMPGMTMVFRIKDEAMLDKLREGSNIEFIAERVDGKLMVTEIR